MEDSPVFKYDELDVRGRTDTKSFLQESEQVLFSGLVQKINKYKVSQERILVITNRYLYNIVPKDNMVSSIAQWFSPTSALKRKISTSKISEITVSIHPLSEQFIIHVEGEYDYRYSGAGKRDKIIESIIHAHFEAGKPMFALYLKEAEDLAAFHTTDDDFKAKIIKRPSLGKVLVTPQLLEKGLDYIIEKRDTFMMKGNTEGDLNKVQSEIREKRAETFGSYNGPVMHSVALGGTNFDREKPIHTIDDIPLCESGVIPRHNPNK